MRRFAVRASIFSGRPIPFLHYFQTEVPLVAPDHICLPHQTYLSLGRFGLTEIGIVGASARNFVPQWGLRFAEILCVFQKAQVPLSGQKSRGGAGHHSRGLTAKYSTYQEALRTPGI